MLRNSLVSGVLRASAARANPPRPFLAASVRFFSNLIPQVHKIPGSLVFHHRFLSPQPCSHRMLSLGSIFSRLNPVAAPTPLIVAHITRLEAEANVHPHDMAKQLVLFEALLATNLKSSYELIITRWEKMCEFDPTSPLLKSPAAFKIYLTALQNAGQSTSIPIAVQKRDSLLAAQETAIADGTDPAVVDSSGSTSKASLLGNSTTSLQPTSQDIARDVLATPSSPALLSSNSVLGPFKQTLNSETAQTAPIQVSIVERKAAWLPRLVRFIFYMLFAGFFFLAILSVFFENSGLMTVSAAQPQFEATDGKVVKFSDVHGVDEAKEELQDVVAFLKDPASFATLGGKLPKGVLLTGPPGTGKTLLARAVAGEAGVPFFFAAGSDFEEMYVGLGARRVRELFASARKKQPAIIFIDELDAVGGKRSNRDQHHMKQTLNQLLVEMDGFLQTEGVVVIAATNFPESLDQALVRPGRFDKTIAVPLPDLRGRIQILQHHMRGVTVSKGVDSKILARGTAGFSGADLQNMVNQAAIQASKLRAKEVDLLHFEWAKDRIVMGAERRSHYLDPKSKLATAYHEGGHAIVALYTDGAMPLHKVTCMPRGHALGFTALLPEDDRNSISFKQYLAGIDVSMGGRAAEELIYGSENVSSGASSDIRQATKTAEAMVKNWGFSKLGPVYYGDPNRLLSARRREEIDEEVTSLVRGGEARAMALLSSKMTELHRLAHALVEHETLNLEEVKKVIEGEPLRTISEELEDNGI